ncbi:MAG: hypothetical protein OEW70_08220, partial [candidate division WOR-3 bacterium]|nr:hypothetical protein [candidate division WOR-3 bacterium]
MSRTKTLLLLTCTFLLVFASTPDFVKAPLRVKTDGINVSPDFSSFIHPSAAEMFEEPPASPLAITWQARAAVPATRYRTAGCGDTSGHFYVTGGWTNSVASNVTYQYFANGDSWHVARPMLYANSNHCAIFHPPTNKIFVFCGYDGAVAMNWTQIYDIANDTWTLGASCFLAMLGTYGAAVGDSIFITGTDLSAFSLGLWCYRVSTNTWSYVGALPGTGASGGAASYGNKVYFTGGWPSRDTVTMYEIGVGVTPSFAFMPRGQHGHGTEEVNGKLWVFGGGQSWGAATAAVYSYDLSQGSGGSWATENSMISTRYAGAFGKMFYPDTWRLHAATGLTGVSTRFLLHERGTIPPPPPTDAMLLKINAPSSATPPSTSVNPNVTIRNAGTDTISNIPVTIWIDSAGVRIYNQSQTYSGTLNSGDTANINFTPTFPVGPLGSGYVVTAFTAYVGDLDPSNDTLSRLVYLPGLIWTAMPPHPATSYRTGGCGDTMGHFYVYGGYTTTYSNQCTRYDVTSGTWTTLSNMLTGVMNITGDYDLARDRIYVPGGYSP